MTKKCYIELLEKKVAFWPADAVLEEDGGSGHSKTTSNPVRTWEGASQPQILP